MGPNSQRHTYRLHLNDDRQGMARDIEFDARGSDIALEIAHKFCGSRPVTLFEDERKLADLKHINGVWHVS